MLDEKSFRELFYEALQTHQREYNVRADRIVKAIAAIQKEYAPKKWSSCESTKLLDFDDPAYRCGYLHKYASCHAAMVCCACERIGPAVFENLFADVTVANICCIGGGPGTDVIGLCALFCEIPQFCDKTFHFDVVDCMLEWRSAFATVFKAALKYGSFGEFLASSVTSSYLRADMLSCITNAVQETICSADLVTMVKFVSAAASEATPRMLKDVFTLMKPGAAVLFIDNAGGEFYELVSDAAHRCRLVNLSGPIRHMPYGNKAFRRHMFGVFGLSSTTVAVQMWEKAYTVTLNVLGNQLTSKHQLNNKDSNFSGAKPRNSTNSVCNKKIEHRNSSNCATSSTFDTVENSNESSLASKKTPVNTDNSRTKMTFSTINTSYSRTPVLKKTIESSAISQLSKYSSSAGKSPTKVIFSTADSLSSQTLVFKNLDSSAVVELKKSQTSPSVVAQCNQNTLSRPGPEEVNIRDHCTGIGTNIYIYHADGSNISQQKIVRDEPTPDTGSRDFGVQHSFTKGESNSLAHFADSRDSRESKCEKKGKKSTGCCVVL